MRRILDIIIIVLSLLLVFFSAYNVLGKPFTLHRAVTRIFKDQVNEYSIKDHKLTISADEKGWDGTQWTEGEATTEGKKDVLKVFKEVRAYDPSIKAVQITVTYLDQPLFTYLKTFN